MRLEDIEVGNRQPFDIIDAVRLLSSELLKLIEIVEDHKLEIDSLTRDIEKLEDYES